MIHPDNKKSMTGMLRAVLLLAVMTVPAIAVGQSSLRAILPRLWKAAAGKYSENYVRVGNSLSTNVSYRISLTDLPADSLSARLRHDMREAAMSDMDSVSEADHYIDKRNGYKAESFTLRDDEEEMRAMLTIGNTVSFMYSQKLTTPRPEYNILLPLDSFIETNYGKYVTGKDQKEDYIELVNKTGNSIFTPVTRTTYTIPAGDAAKAYHEIAHWLRSHALTLGYASMDLKTDNMQVNYASNETANEYYFMLQSDGSLDIIRQITNTDDIVGDVVAGIGFDAEMKGKNITDGELAMIADGDYYNTWNLPLAEQNLPDDISLAFSLERRSDMTVMHLRKKIYSNALETWTDSSQTYIVDEETQVHYMARSCSPAEIWGKMIRVMDIAGKTIAVDIYFPPLPPGVNKFSVWGLGRFGIYGETLYTMKRDGDLYMVY